MLVVATVSFILIRLAPGDPASVIAGPYATGDDIARLQRSLGLDQALPVQLVKWWGRLARGDLGDSIFLRRPVLEAIFERLEPTLLLTAWAMLVAVAVGVPAGVVSARYHNTTVDQSLMAFALIGLSIPNFLLGLLMILFFGVWLGWLPVAGYVPLEGGLWLNLRSLIMPSLALGLVQSALIARITRSSMLDVLREQYILAGRSKGLSERVVDLQARAQERHHPHPHRDRHHLRAPGGGAVVIETVFNIPGLGRLIISAVLRRDYPVVQGVVLLIAAYTAINLLVDLAYLVRPASAPWPSTPASGSASTARQLRVFLPPAQRRARRRSWSR